MGPRSRVYLSSREKAAGAVMRPRGRAAALGVGRRLGHGAIAHERLPREDPAHHGLEELEGQALIARVERLLVPLLAELHAVGVVGAAPVALARVGVQAHVLR